MRDFQFHRVNTLKVFRRRLSVEQIQTLESLVRYAVDSDQPLRFVTYWGASDKVEIGTPEKQAIQFIHQVFETLQSAIEGVQQKFELTILLADLHAEGNGYNPSDISKYYQTLKDYQFPFPVQFVYLSDFLSSHKDVKQNYHQSGQEDKDLAKIRSNDRLMSRLLRGADKYSKEQSLEESVNRYIRARLSESHVLDERLQNHVFLTSDADTFLPILPQRLLVMQTYSTAPGRCYKPWFTKEGATPGLNRKKLEDFDSEKKSG